jgi:hypothetical protein
MAASAILLVDVAYDSPAALTLRHGGLAVRTGAPQGVFLFCQARRAMPVLYPASAEPATSGLRELVDAAPVWIARSLRVPAEAGPLG